MRLRFANGRMAQVIVMQGHHWQSGSIIVVQHEGSINKILFKLQIYLIFDNLNCQIERKSRKLLVLNELARNVLHYKFSFISFLVSVYSWYLETLMDLDS